MIAVWRRVGGLLERRSRMKAGLLAGLSLVAGALEAVLLVLVVGAALSVTSEGQGDSVSLALGGGASFSPGVALSISACLGLVVLVVHIVVARLTAELAAEVLRTARERVIDAFSNASWARQAHEREGALQETSMTLAKQSAELCLQLTNFAAGGLGVVALIAAALIVSPLIAVLVFAFGVLLTGILLPIRRVTRTRAREFVGLDSAFSEQISQWSALAMEQRVFGVVRIGAGRLVDVSRATSRSYVRSRFTTRVGGSMYRDLAIMFLVGAVAFLHLAGDVNVVPVGAVVMLIVRSLSYAQQAQASMQLTHETAPNLDALTERIASLKLGRSTFGDRTCRGFSTIELVDVGYAYDHGRDVLRHIGFSISKGEAVGVIGPSGGGKSTLLQVLLRLRPPSSGRVLVDGVDYLDISPDDWSRLVAFVPQDPKLFQGTVADNIAFWRPAITRAQVTEAARQAHVIDDILRLPHGFDTQLGPSGAGLSGGQKQRLAFARAMVGQPQLLVLDEPTSALDARSEGLIQETIMTLRGKVALVIVAHRNSTLSSCGRVVALADGTIEVVGTLDEALAAVGLDSVGLVDSRPEPRQ